MLRHASYRCALPVAHTVLDLLLVLVWIYDGMLLKDERAHFVLPQTIATVAYPQENAAVTWDPPNPRTPEFVLLLSGTLPAGIIATNLRPEVGWHSWDPIWLAIHETIAIALWLLIGALVDAGRPRLGKWMRI